MGNIINISNKEGQVIAQASHGLACLAYVQHIAKKYKPDFMVYPPEKINDELKVVYKKATPEDTIVLLIFINDKSNFTEEDIPAFEKAIKDYPQNFNDGPKKVLEKYLELLKKHKELKTEYVGVTTAMSIMEE